MSYFHKFVELSRAMFTILPNLFALQQIADSPKKIGLVGTLEGSTPKPSQNIFLLNIEWYQNTGTLC